MPVSAPPKNQGLDPSITQGIAAKVLQAFLLTPALSIMPLLRTGIGLRIIRGRQIVITAVIMYFISTGLGTLGFLANATGTAQAFGGGVRSGLPLLLLMLLFLPLAIIQNRSDWRRILEGGSGSTYSRGVPRYAARIGINGDKAARWIDPILILALALVCAFFSRLLGVWLLVAGFSLALFEQVSQERYLNDFLDVLDAGYYGERMQEELRAVEQGGEAAKPAYDGVVPSLPARALRTLQERQRQLKQRVSLEPPSNMQQARIRYDAQTGKPIYQEELLSDETQSSAAPPVS